MRRACKASTGILLLLLSFLLLAAGLGAPLFDGGAGHIRWGSFFVWMMTGIYLGAIGFVMLDLAGLFIWTNAIRAGRRRER